jgi:hypothetical protein
MIHMIDNDCMPDRADKPLAQAFAYARNLPLLPERLVRFSMDEFGMSYQEAERLVAGFFNGTKAD